MNTWVVSQVTELQRWLNETNNVAMSEIPLT